MSSRLPRQTPDAMARASSGDRDEGPALSKVAIPGPTLASILHRASSSPGDVDGLLFGRVYSAPAPPSDSDADSPTSLLFFAAVSAHLAFNSTLSFYDPLGRLLPLPASPSDAHPLLGWLVSRRRSPLRPSARDAAVSSSLAKTFPPGVPLILLIISPSPSSSAVHTHEYRAFQFLHPRGSHLPPQFEPKSVEIVNIGPAFRPHYGDFRPHSPFPLMRLGEEQGARRSLQTLKKVSKEQEELNACAEGYEVGRLGRMISIEAPHCLTEMEDLYAAMLAKLESMDKAMEECSSEVREQENYNMELRRKCAGLK